MITYSFIISLKISYDDRAIITRNRIYASQHSEIQSKPTSFNHVMPGLKMKYLYITIILIVLMPISSGFSQNKSRVVSLNECLTIAIQNNQSIISDEDRNVPRQYQSLTPREIL